MPCCLTKIVGFHVPPADVPSGSGSNPTVAHPPHDASGAARERRRPRRERRGHAWTPPSDRLRSIHRSRPEGSRATCPSAPPWSRPSEAGPAPGRFHVRCHQTKNAAESTIASPATHTFSRTPPISCDGSIAQRLDPEPADAVDQHVQREQAARPDPALEAALDEQEHARRRRSTTAPRTGTSDGTSPVDVVDRPVLGVDLEAPRQVRRTAEELLVPPVAEAADALRDEERRARRSPRASTTDTPERFATIAPTMQPSPIPPQTPSPPFQIANGPHHSSGSSSQLVMTW